MKTADEILREYINFDDVTSASETVSLLPLTITDAMQEYAQQFIDNILPTNDEIDKASKKYVIDNSVAEKNKFLAMYDFTRGAKFVQNYTELKN